ncbi:hypothetical protein V2J09_007887 [Rumex salicifolius]
MENQSDKQSDQSKSKNPFTIEIPSYKEVLESSQSKSTAPSLFAPSQTFSQAFASIKNSEFYSPPPPPTQRPVSTPSESDVSSSSRKIGETEALHSSFSASKGNPLLKYIRNVRWNFAEIIPDYVLGINSCALYLSLRYHLLHPDYLYFRIRELQKNFRLRVVLCHVDVEDVVKPLLEVTRTALLHDCTLLCGWSLEECGRYLETIKVYENKPADLIQQYMGPDYMSRLNHALTSIRRVNKADVVTLGSTFGSLAHIMDASMEDLARCPGIGERKVKRLYDTFHEPFKRVIPLRPSAPVAPSQSNAEPIASARPPISEEGKRSNKRKKILQSIPRRLIVPQRRKTQGQTFNYGLMLMLMRQTDQSTGLIL